MFGIHGFRRFIFSLAVLLSALIAVGCYLPPTQAAFGSLDDEKTEEHHEESEPENGDDEDDGGDGDGDDGDGDDGDGDDGDGDDGDGDDGDGDGVELGAPTLVLLSEIEDGAGNLRANFDLHVTIELDSDVPDDAELYVSVHRSGDPANFAVHDPANPVTSIPDTIPSISYIEVSAYIEYEDEQSDTYSETYTLEYDTISVSLDGDDSNVGSSTRPVQSLGEAIARVGGSGEIAQIRIQSGNYGIDGEGGLLAGALELLPTDDDSETAVLISGLSDLQITGSFTDNFYDTGGGETILDASGEADHVLTIGDSSSNITLEHLTLTGGGRGGNNTRGGGLAIFDSEYVIVESSVRIVDNQASQGGGIYVLNGAGHRFRGEVSDNIANGNGGGSALGGGIAIEGATGTGHRVEGNIERNRAADGGGVFVAEGSGHVVNALIEDNRATSYGAGVSADNTTSFSLSGTIRSNTVPADDDQNWLEGGGVALWRVTDYLLLAPLTIEWNYAGWNGGGIYAFESSMEDYSEEGIIIENNTADDSNDEGGGGGFFNDTGSSFPAYRVPENFEVDVFGDGDEPLNDPNDLVEL